jgi:hypothetical protein
MGTAGPEAVFTHADAAAVAVATTNIKKQILHIQFNSFLQDGSAILPLCNPAIVGVIAGFAWRCSLP